MKTRQEVINACTGIRQAIKEITKIHNMASEVKFGACVLAADAWKIAIEENGTGDGTLEFKTYLARHVEMFQQNSDAAAAMAAMCSSLLTAMDATPSVLERVLAEGEVKP